VADPTITAELVHLGKGYAGSGLACGITGRVRVTERLMDATCPRCRHDGDPVPRTRALDVEKAHAEALVEDAARPAEQPADPATTAQAAFTRPIRIGWDQLRPGDQVDNSIPGGDPVGDTILKVVPGGHADDESNEDRADDDPGYCWGDCVAVVFFEDEDCAYPLHVHKGAEEVTVRLLAEVQPGD
jgi:nucleotide-binding universal stress UspA family protein